MCQHQFKLSSPDALRKSIGKLLFTSEKSISWVKRFEKLRKVSKKKKKTRERERERESYTGRERERERERGGEEEEEEEEEEDEDEVAAAKSVHDPDSRIFLQVHAFFFFFQI